MKWKCSKCSRAEIIKIILCSRDNDIVTANNESDNNGIDDTVTLIAVKLIRKAAKKL